MLVGGKVFVIFFEVIFVLVLLCFEIDIFVFLMVECCIDNGIYLVVGVFFVVCVLVMVKFYGLVLFDGLKIWVECFEFFLCGKFL